MTIQQIYYAIVIAEVRSMNKAAEILYVSQPTLTGAVRELEKDLGITIFNRSGKGVSVTNDGREFLEKARQLYDQYEQLAGKYRDHDIKIKFSISAQHYSFAVKAFVETVRRFDLNEYEFAIMETKTKDVISDVANAKSEIGILYISDFNRRVITKMLQTNGIEFHPLISCQAYVYLWKGHPLAAKKSITFAELKDYPCLMFDQGESGTYYYNEEILSMNEYPKVIRANDRATNLNLMVGLNAYTLCSGIICEELNGSDFIAVPYEPDEENPSDTMEIGYITLQNMKLSKPGEIYIQELKKYLGV